MSEILRPIAKESVSSNETTDSGLDLGVAFAREVSESLPATPAENDSGSTTTSSKKTSAAKKDDSAAQAYKQKVAALKASKPTPKVMIRDIQSAVRAQLTVLEKKKTKYKNAGPKGYFKYNKAVAEVRSMRKLLSGLLYRTYEELKALWLRVVHNVA